MSRRPTRALATTLAGLLMLFGSLASARASEPSPELTDLLASFDAVQSTITTLTAEFTETTTSMLLKDPIIASGKIFMTKPSSVR